MDILKVRADAREKAIALTRTFNKMRISPLYKNHGLTINILFLVYACESCFIDLERHGDFHAIDLPDNHKRAAYIFKWLTHMRPVFATGPGHSAGNAASLHVNAYFALLAALSELEVDMARFSPTNIAQHIIYNGTYRDIHPQTWGIIFCLIEQLYHKKTHNL